MIPSQSSRARLARPRGHDLFGNLLQVRAQERLRIHRACGASVSGETFSKLFRLQKL
jgi:hypothetical protein